MQTTYDFRLGVVLETTPSRTKTDQINLEKRRKTSQQFLSSIYFSLSFFELLVYDTVYMTINGPGMAAILIPISLLIERPRPVYEASRRYWPGVIRKKPIKLKHPDRRPTHGPAVPKRRMSEVDGDQPTDTASSVSSSPSR